MRHRILAAAIVAATLVPASGLPAQLLGGITGTFQRAQMIANQIAGLANQVRQLSTMARQVSELEEQLDHMKRVARGQVDALTQPFSELAAGSVGLVGEELGWGSDFSGAGGGLVNAVRDMGSTSSFTELWRGARGAADRVGEAEILELFRSHPPEASSRAVADYRQAREAADRQSVLDYAMLDAAAALAATIENAQGSFDALTTNGNLSHTALQQAEVAAALTQGQINAAAGQVLAYQAVEQANRMRQAELARLERLGAWRASQLRANETLERMQAAVAQNREVLRDGLLFRVHPFYMGGQY